MADLLVDRCADTVGIAFVIQRCGNAAHVACHCVNEMVDFRCIHAFMNLPADLVQYRHIDFTAFSDLLNLFRRFDHLMVWNLMTVERQERQMLVKRRVTTLVFFAAAAPAGVVASGKMQKKKWQCMHRYSFR